MTFANVGSSLELLNGFGALVEILFLLVMLRYLLKESTRRKMTFERWITWRLPPSMNFVIAVVVFDSGVCLRSIATWVWRRFYGAGDFGLIFSTMLIIGLILMVVGGLCKIRAITQPDLGQGPWLLSLAALFIFGALNVYL